MNPGALPLPSSLRAESRFCRARWHISSALSSLMTTAARRAGQLRSALRSRHVDAASDEGRVFRRKILDIMKEIGSECGRRVVQTGCSSGLVL